MRKAQVIEWGIDEGILPVVMVLNDAGFDTFSSCQGGEGHAFASPTVRIKLPASARGMAVEAEIGRMAEVLIEAGYGGFYIKHIRSYQLSGEWQPDSQPFIEVEFWADRPVPAEVQYEHRN